MEISKEQKEYYLRGLYAIEDLKLLEKEFFHLSLEQKDLYREEIPSLIEKGQEFFSILSPKCNIQIVNNFNESELDIYLKDLEKIESWIHSMKYYLCKHFDIKKLKYYHFTEQYLKNNPELLKNILRS